jgi:hypothetical protein
MTDSAPRRWLSPKPAWLTLGLLVVEGLLWFNEKKGWTILITVAAVGVFILAMLLWLVASFVFRRRLQFSIRSLFVLTNAVAITCSWRGVEMKKATEQREAVNEITNVGGKVEYDWRFNAGPLRNLQPPEPEWIRNLLGGDFFDKVVQASLKTDAQMVRLQVLTQLRELDLGTTDADGLLVDFDTRISDAGLAHLAGLKQLKSLVFNGTQITDGGLAHLTGLNQLQELDLGIFEITDAGIAHLAGLPRLKDLILSDTQITDDGLAHLAGLTQLQSLVLDRSQITDAGLAHLAGLSQLQSLSLRGTIVTDDGVKKLQKALPNCEIDH